MAAGRLDIINQVKTGLDAITTGNGYSVTVGGVEKVLRDWNDSETFPRPWIGFRPAQESYKYEMSHRLRCTLQLQLVAHVTPAAGAVDAVYTQIENLSDDIIRALRQGVLRSGCAESITLTQTQTTEGDPSSFESASLSMLFNIVYYRTEPTG